MNQELEDKLEELRKRKYELEREEYRDMKSLADEVFESEMNLSPLGVYIECNHHSIEFKRPHPDSSWDKELFSIYIRNNYGRNDDEPAVRELEISYYTTSENSDFELGRLILLGQTTQTLVKQKEKLLAGINHIKSRYKPSQSELFDQIWKIEIELKELESQQRASKNERFLNLLTTVGLTFDRHTVDYLKHNDSNWDVVGAKAGLPKPSSKTYNVELTIAAYTAGEFYKRVVERVKVESLYHLAVNSVEYKAEE